jgi:sec-independent protein translocase protein TatB
MDHIGFSELVLLGIIALIVLGPEKLPGAIRTTSLWIGRLKRSFNTIKTDIEREIGADEIRRQLRNEAIMDKFKQTKAQVNDAVNTVKKQTDEFRKNIELEAKTLESATNPLGTPKKVAPDEGLTGQSPLAGAPAQPAPAAIAPSVPAEAAVAAPQPAATAQPDSSNTP